MLRFQFRYVWLLVGLAVVPPVAAIYLKPLPPESPAEVERAMREDWDLDAGNQLRVLEVRPVSRTGLANVKVTGEAVVDIVMDAPFPDTRYLTCAFRVVHRDREPEWVLAMNPCFAEPASRQITAEPSKYELNRFRGAVKGAPEYWMYGPPLDQPVTFHFGFSGR